MDAAERSAYEARVKASGEKQARANLANHDRLVASDRWAQLDEGTKGRLEEMAAILRAFLAK